MDKHVMSVHADLEVEMGSHRELKMPSKYSLMEKLEGAWMEALIEANPDKHIQVMDIDVQIPNGQMKR